MPFYSDDHGTTWQRGQLVKAQTNENQFVELADGVIMMDARQGAGDHRWLMLSKGRRRDMDRPGTRTNRHPGSHFDRTLHEQIRRR